MELTPVQEVTTGVLRELQDNLSLPLVISAGRRTYIETNVQLLMAQFPNVTAKRLYYSDPDIYETLPGKELYSALERVAAATLTQDLRRI